MMSERHLLSKSALVIVLAILNYATGEERWGGLPESMDIMRSMSMHTEPGKSFDPVTDLWVEQVGIKPKVYVYHNFLTPAERAHIIRLSAPMMRRSTVVGQKGEGVVDDIRTSYGMFIKRLNDPIIERIERRISLVTHYPVSHQEDIQVLRYTKGQKYGAHYDSSSNTDEPGPHYRMATFYMYLSDVEEGGETAFPQGSEWIDPAIPAKMEAAGIKFSDCAKGNVAYPPRAGDAVLFWSFHPNQTMDSASLHTGCPVIKGIKWGCPVWIHNNEFRGSEFVTLESRRNKGMDYPKEPGLCRDNHKMCRQWADNGECNKNPEFMIGSQEAVGMCMAACGVCRSCAPNDVNCINENRAKSGYLPLDRAEMEWLGVNWWFNNEPSPEL